MRNPLIPELSLPSTDAVPEVSPLSAEVPRPRWSVMIPTLNRPEMLQCALESVLAQGYSIEDMQICVVDNATANADIETLVKQIGENCVEYVRQPETVAVGINWTTCLQHARGEFVHILHDDNIVLPGCYQAYEDHMKRTGCEVIFSQIVTLNPQGQWLDLSKRITTKDGIAVDPYEIILNQNTFTIMTLVAPRRLFERVGGYRTDFFYGLDQEMTYRLINNASIGFLDRPYIVSVSHIEQASHDYWLEAKISPDMLLPWQYMSAQPGSSPTFKRRAYRHLSQLFHILSQSALTRGYNRVAIYQAWWAFRLTPSLEALTHAIVIGGKVFTRKFISKPLALVRRGPSIRPQR